MEIKLIAVICLLSGVICFVGAKSSDKVRLEKIQTLTLQADRWTTGRRSSPIKQLSCVGGYCRQAKVATAQCYNRGFDGRDVQWECKAEMPSNYKFGRVEVICEGYDYPEDDYVLVGSCGLEYVIEETGDQPSYSSQSHYYSAQKHIQNSDFSYWPIIGLVIVIALIYFTCIRDNTANNANAYSSTSDDYPRPSAPPPPGFRTDYFDSGDSCSGSRSNQSSGSSGPGFYSGMAAGGLMGYLFGSSRSNTYANRPSYSGWNYGPSTSGMGASSSSSSSSGSHTSSGYGSTRRR